MAKSVMEGRGTWTALSKTVLVTVTSFDPKPSDHVLSRGMKSKRRKTGKSEIKINLD